MSLRARAIIHLHNIAENWRQLHAVSNGTQTAAVIKADAYGHGLAPVAKALKAAGCSTFFVAHTFEGVEARAALGNDTQIFVLNGPSEADKVDLERHKLAPVINSVEQLALIEHWAWPTDRPYALHFDTGMNRLGLNAALVPEISLRVAARPPAIIMSHLACADQTASVLNDAQRAAFAHIASHFPGIQTSLTNSAGLCLSQPLSQSLSRPGYALYGGGQPPRGVELRPGMILEAPILQVRTVDKDGTTGYGATHPVTAGTGLAALAIGYGDGFPRSASNSGFAMLKGFRCPIVGRISMDLTVIDVTKAGNLARPGHYVQLIGPDAPLDLQAHHAGTIGYELTTGLTSRVERHYA